MSELLKGVNLYLIGMMGAGKSTVGKVLANTLGYRFFDTDTVIEQAAQQPIPQIFAESGETAFRQLETQVLSQLSAYTNLVVATGGGIVVTRQNWSYLHHGIVVWLDVPTDVLFERLKDDQSRPLLQSPDPQKTLQVILNQRVPLYAQADLTLTIASGDTPEAIAQRILHELPTILKSPTPPTNDST